MSLIVERRYRLLLGPVDQGELGLPEEVVTARAAVARLSAAVAGLPVLEPAHVAEGAAVRAAVGSPDPGAVDLTGIVEHERQTADLAHRKRILNRALEVAEAELAAVLEDSTDRIIEEFIRPAGERLWTSIVRAVGALDGIAVITTDAMLRAEDKARRAFLELDSLSGQYGRLRQAWSPLPAGQDVEHDTSSDHGEFEAGLCTIIGPGWRGSPMAQSRPKPPWPDDPRDRLVWMVRAGHRPWFPTPDQRDAAWLTAHREEHERYQRQISLGQNTHLQWAQTG